MTMAQREAFDDLLPRPHIFHFVVAATCTLGVLAGLYMGNPGVALVQFIMLGAFTLLGISALKRRRGALDLIEGFEDESLKLTPEA